MDGNHRCPRNVDIRESEGARWCLHLSQTAKVVERNMHSSDKGGLSLGLHQRSSRSIKGEMKNCSISGQSSALIELMIFNMFVSWAALQ